MTTITALPTAPTRGDPATFAATADTFLSALPTFGTQCNAVASEVNQAAGIANSLAAAFMLPGYRGTSTSSVTFGTGSKTLTTQNNLLFVAGMSVTLSLTASATSYMQGTVTSYSGTTLVLNITSSNASGTYNDWQITPTNTDLVVKNQAVGFSSSYGNTYIHNYTAAGTYFFTGFGTGGGPNGSPTISNSAFNESTGLFTCAVAGTYIFNLDFRFRGNSDAGEPITVGYSKNGGTLYDCWEHSESGSTGVSWDSYHCSFMVTLAVADTIKVGARIASPLTSTNQVYIQGTASGFSGYLLR